MRAGFATRQDAARTAPMPPASPCDHGFELEWDRVDGETWQATCVCGAVLERGTGSEEVRVVGHVEPRDTREVA